MKWLTAGVCSEHMPAVAFLKKPGFGCKRMKSMIEYIKEYKK